MSPTHALKLTALLAGLLLAALTLTPTPAWAQNASGSLAATVYDPSGAVIPSAKIVLTGEGTRAVRETATNSRGFFNLSAIQPGAYTLTITAPGFAVWKRTSIVFTQGENETLPNVILQVGAATERVQVEADAQAIAPTDTGEARQTLDENMVNRLPIEGRDAAELIKIMPGVAMNRGLSQSAWNSLVTQSNVGPIGQYSASGTQPNGGMTMTMDGANLLDPGNQGTQVANINQEQTAEVTLLYSAYGAEYAKGPVTFQAIGKSGTAHFHGSVYLYLNSPAMDSVDSFLKSQGGKKTMYRGSYYPGVDIGGPVFIPHTGFNRSHNKLFFYAAPEGMLQTPAPSYMSYFIPTPEMLAGNFSPAYLASLGSGFAAAKTELAGQPTEHGGATAYPGGMIPLSMLDPNSLAYAKTFTHGLSGPGTYGGGNNAPTLYVLAQPNATGNNFFYQSGFNVNRFEFRLRLDYNISDSTKLFVSWNRQDEDDVNPIGVWWYPGNALPYPSSMPAHLVSNVYNGNLVHVFGPSLTNETVVTMSQFLNPVRLQDPAAVNLAQVGLTGYQPVTPDPYMAQIPDLVSQNNLVPGYYAPAFGGGFQNGDYGKRSLDPSIADNLTKVAGTHTVKFGAYWDFAENTQAGADSAQGMLDLANTGATTTGNLMADFLTGRFQSFQQSVGVGVYDMKYSQYSFYAQDQWKVSRRLTLTYGVRLDHMGQWCPMSGQGLAVWDPASYSNSPTAPAWTGLLWHGIDSKIPMSGFPSKLFFPEPRIGFAFDLFGKGATVLRGGFGVYRYQISYNSATNPGLYDEPSGVPSYNILNPQNLGWNFAQYPTSPGAAGLGSNIGVMQQGDARTPHTASYSLILSQQTPWHSTAEIQYSGNRSSDLLLSGNGFNVPFIGNLNKTPLGAYFLPDPLTGVVNDPTQGGLPSQDYRSYANYQTMLLVSHGSYQNYNSLVATWNKPWGPATFMLNYTFGKVLGIRDGESDNGAGNGPAMDPWNLRDNYGPLSYDHTQIFNAAYVVNLPKPIHSGVLLGGVLNGWIVSGMTHVESGAPIQPNTNGNLNLMTSGGLNSVMWLGTDSENLLPALTCDPSANLKPGQYFNPACFALAPQGTNGPTVWPYIRGPHYFNSDLAIYKTFKFHERHQIELRLEAFNFVNHPLKMFNANGAYSDLSLAFAKPVAGTVNSNSLTTGFPLYSVGYRVGLVSLKYNF